MALIFPVNGLSPKWGNQTFIAPNATLVGDVIMGDECSVWFQAVLRADVNSIRIGNKVNIQDGVILHGTYQKASLSIGNEVSVGHRAILHGCTIEDQVLVGMGAIVMDHAVVKKHVIIAAGAVVTENMILESGFIYAGVPAKKLKPIDTEQISGMINRIANNYLTYSTWFNEINEAN